MKIAVIFGILSASWLALAFTAPGQSTAHPTTARRRSPKRRRSPEDLRHAGAGSRRPVCCGGFLDVDALVASSVLAVATWWSPVMLCRDKNRA